MVQRIECWVRCSGEEGRRGKEGGRRGKEGGRNEKDLLKGVVLTLSNLYLGSADVFHSETPNNAVILTQVKCTDAYLTFIRLSNS